MYATIFARAYSGGSRAAGVKAKCLECVGLKRDDITNCTASPGSLTPCPLWPYRPYQGAGEVDPLRSEQEDNDDERGDGEAGAVPGQAA